VVSSKPTKALTALCHLRTIGEQINTRLLEAEQLNHACRLSPSHFERLQQPIPLGTRRVSALRFDDPRVHALRQAISHFGHVPGASKTGTCVPWSRPHSVENWTPIRAEP
jgi:hypothetical protein